MSEHAESAVDRELAQAWVEALESGEYTRTTGFLHTDAGYCCLGVLCDVTMNLGRVQGHWSNGDTGIYTFFVEDRGDGYGSSDTRMLPAFLANRVGLRGLGGGREDDTHWKFDTKESDGLAEANDDDVTFDQIAVALRDYYAMPARETVGASA